MVLKRLFSFLLSVVILLLLVYFCTEKYTAESSVSLSNVGEVLSAYSDSNGGFHILSNYNGTYKITHLEADNSMSEYTINIPVSHSSFTYSCDKFYFLENFSYINQNTEQKYITITVFDCIDGYTYKSAINSINCSTDINFAVSDNGEFYLPNDHSIEVYSSNSQYIKTIDTKSRPLCITSSPDGAVIYCSTIEDLTVIYSSNVTVYSIKAQRIYTGENNYFSTDSGEVYRFNGTGIESVYTLNSSIKGVGIIDDYIIDNQNGTLCASSNGETLKFGDYGESAVISSSNGRSAYLINDGYDLKIIFITYDDISQAQMNDNENDTPGKSVISDFQEYYIKSDCYKIDENNNIITGIQPGETIANIKKNIQYGSYSISFCDYSGASKTSGNIGTGSIVTFTGGGQTKSFTIVVYGDITGEGNINTRDKTEMFNYLLGISSLNDICIKAADINNDAESDLKDLVALSKHLDGNYEIKQNR